jgi:hypothetical protein
MDCDAALDLEAASHKGMFRKALALKGLGQLSEACVCARKAMHLAPRSMKSVTAQLLCELCATISTEMSPD